MTFGEILNFFTLLIALGALGIGITTLCFVGWQVVLARRTLEATQVAIREDRRFRQLDKLDCVGWIITVTVSLERWIDKLDKNRRTLRTALETDEPSRIREIAYSGCVTPHELFYQKAPEVMPGWLLAIWDAAAQHYYNADQSAVLRELWDDDSQSPRASYVRLVCQRTDTSVGHLQELLGYIHDIVPDAYLEAPASIDSATFSQPRTSDDEDRQDDQNRARDA